MTFSRETGQDFDWYAVDKAGSIGLFVSGFAAVPKVVFADEEKYLRTVHYFESLPDLTKANLSQLYESKKDKSLNGFANQVSEARRGIYIFYDKYYTNIYELAAIPDKVLTISSLPNEIQESLNTISFENIIFAEMVSIDVKKFFECID